MIYFERMLAQIQERLRNSQYHITRHAQRRCDTRSISLNDIKKVILTGEAIETYPEDTPYPSCLILGYVREKPLYVLCAVSDVVHIVTVHWLDPHKWLDPKTRREKRP